MDEDSKAPQNEPAKLGHKKSVKKLSWVIFAGLLIAIIIGLVTYYFVTTKHATAPQEFVNAQNSVNFPIYYPAELPPGFTLNKSSISVGGNAVIYACKYEDGQEISISIQPRHTGFTTDQFRPTSEFTTHIGRAYLVDLDDRTTAAVVGKDAWMIINSPQPIAVDIMKQLIDSLRPIED